MDPFLIHFIVKIFLSYGLYHMMLNVIIPASYIKLYNKKVLIININISIS